MAKNDYSNDYSNRYSNQMDDCSNMNQENKAKNKTENKTENTTRTTSKNNMKNNTRNKTEYYIPGSVSTGKSTDTRKKTVIERNRLSVTVFYVLLPGCTHQTGRAYINNRKTCL